MTKTLDRLFHHAQIQPNVIAVVDGGQAIGYGQFARNLCQFIQYLRQFNLQKGDIVAVEWSRLYPHWLFLLACEALGYRCLSYGADDFNNVRSYLSDQATLIIANKPIADRLNHKTHIFDANVYNTITTLEVPTQKPVDILNSDDPMRLQCSSGTTGQPKFMERSLALHNFRINQLQQKDQYSQNSRLILAYNFAVQASYGRATACLEAGGAIIHPHSGSFVEDFIKYNVTHAPLLPTTLKNILISLPKDFQKPKDFTLSTFGGKIPIALRKIAEERLTDKIVESYGTNETGSICTMIDAHKGRILPDVEVEVLDQNNQPAFNQTGSIRIRGKGLVTGYLDDPEKTAAKFIDGWFYPGDVGQKPDKDHLILLGREDDLINIGGVKKLIGDIEDELRPLLNVEDLCLCEALDQNGLQHIWLCLVSKTNIDLSQIQNVTAPLRTATIGQFHIKQVSEIPRTPTNKIKRQELTQKFMQDIRNA